MKPVLLTFGSCQVQLITALLKYSPSACEHFDFATLADYVAVGNAEQIAQEQLPAVAVVWEQIVQGQPTGHRVGQRALIPAGARTIRFPPLDLVSFWPFFGSDPRRRPEPGYPYSRFPFPDGIGAKLATFDLPDEELIACYMDLSVRMMPDLDRLWELDGRRLRARDALSDVQMGEWMRKNAIARRLLYAVDHLSAVAAVHLAMMLVEATPQLAQEATVIMQEINEAVARTGFGGHEAEQVPIHPAVAQHFRLEWYTPGMRYRWHHHRWTHDEYVLNYVRWADWSAASATPVRRA